MTDYDYGTADNVQLTGEQSKNGASGIEGYSLDVRPDPNWPGRSADPSKTRFDTDKMDEIATRIEQMVQTLKNSSTIEDASSASAGAQYGPDSWGAARFLKDATGKVATTVSTYSNDLIINLQSAASAIRAASAQYGGSESANVNTANGTRSQIDSAAQ